MQFRLKRGRPQRKDSEGKDDSKGKDGKGESKRGKTLAKVEEEDRDDAASHYSPKTERGGSLGPANQRMGGVPV